MKKSMITAALMTTFMLGVAPTAFAGPFAEVPANNWAYSSVSQLAKAGLIDNYTDRGNKTITRYEMAILVGKALEHADKADAANKALLDKLSMEYAQELKTLGVRMPMKEAEKNKGDKIQISGSERLRIRSVHDSATPKNGFADKATYGDNRFLLNINMNVENNISAFARFGELSFFGAKAHTNNKFSNGDDGNSTANIDHFGLKVKAGAWDLSLGRQAVKLGQGSIINTGSDFGFNPYFEGLVASTTFDNVTVHAIGGHTNPNANTNILTSNAYEGANWFGADASFKIEKNITLGIAFAHEKYLDNYLSANDCTALNATINFGGGPFTLIAETVKSSASSLNKAWQLTGVYHKDKDTFVLMHVNTQKNAIDQFTNIQQGGYQIAFGASLHNESEWNANIFNWMHDITSAVQSTVMIETNAVKGVSGHNVEGVAGLLYKF
ncbi:hypothetical protein [Sporomusa acidovorans]|uniref:SLH domain-containing protein n=1 Tax=Sporomusa acidovorans (strain ATCC 49682 / DSM 3132 / Mol) TaxID=1123286 RepID=A0ABZ3J229_SPOA4|nr:hypothetical protein [Sporomusa acidovorans]OZC23179.1 hypothetical protein SPACI_08290 [Sporomusa acidovorans DSM 3132]SDE96775.1 hypothetical protein SAMN04488499_102813 [Sporomusa acidovorans]